MLRVNKQLKLVVPIKNPGDDDSKTMYLYCAPIAYDTFKRFYMPIAQVFETIYEKGLSHLGLGVATAMLEDAAVRLGTWDVAPNLPADQVAMQQPFTVKHGLIREMHRLANLYVLRDGAHQAMMLDDALREGYLDEEDVREVDNILTFFTCLYCMHLRGERETLLASGLRMWDASVTSLDFTDYLASLRTSTKGGATGKSGPQDTLSPALTSYAPS